MTKCFESASKYSTELIWQFRMFSPGCHLLKSLKNCPLKYFKIFSTDLADNQNSLASVLTFIYLMIDSVVRCIQILFFWNRWIFFYKVLHYYNSSSSEIRPGGSIQRTATAVKSKAPILGNISNPYLRDENHMASNFAATPKA